MTDCASRHTTDEGIWYCQRKLEREGLFKHEGPHHGVGGNNNVLKTWSTRTSE